MMASLACQEKTSAESHEFATLGELVREVKSVWRADRNVSEEPQRRALRGSACAVPYSTQRKGWERALPALGGGATHAAPDPGDLGSLRDGKS
jgi:hypothetical protein